MPFILEIWQVLATPKFVYKYLDWSWGHNNTPVAKIENKIFNSNNARILYILYDIYFFSLWLRKRAFNCSGKYHSKSPNFSWPQCLKKKLQVKASFYFFNSIYLRQLENLICPTLWQQTLTTPISFRKIH